MKICYYIYYYITSTLQHISYTVVYEWQNVTVTYQDEYTVTHGYHLCSNRCQLNGHMLLKWCQRAHMHFVCATWLYVWAWQFSLTLGNSSWQNNLHSSSTYLPCFGSLEFSQTREPWPTNITQFCSARSIAWKHHLIMLLLHNVAPVSLSSRTHGIPSKTGTLNAFRAILGTVFYHNTLITTNTVFTSEGSTWSTELTLTQPCRLLHLAWCSN